jgi:hypothetical protein
MATTGLVDHDFHFLLISFAFCLFQERYRLIILLLILLRSTCIDPCARWAKVKILRVAI